MDLKTIFQNIGVFGNGFDQTSILLCLCLLDTSLGISVRLQHHKGLHSQKFLAGVIHNFIPALIPGLLTASEYATKHFIGLYSVVSLILFLLIAYFMAQSILANASLLGARVQWLQRWLDHEIEEKMNKP